jgi:hypothetical protein
LNAGREGIVAHDGVAPHGSEEILLAHWLACALDEQAQHPGRLAREPDLGLCRPQPACCWLERMAAETNSWIFHIGHGAPPGSELAVILQFN